MLKSYLIRTAGIVMVASLAGVAHYAVKGDEIEFVKLEAINTSVSIPTNPPAESGNESSKPEVQDQVNTEDSATPDDLQDVVPIEINLDREITTEQARLLFDNDLADFIDARSKDEYEDGHIQTAYRMSPDSFDNGTPYIIDMFDEERVVVVYCSGGACHDSHIVIDQIMEIRPELTRLHVYTDGYPGWTAAGLPTEIGLDPFAE